MSDEERVNPTIRIPPSFWLVAGLAVLLALGLPRAIRDSGVVGSVLTFIVLEAVIVYWAYRLIEPYLTIWSWTRDGEYERREWSPEERGLQRGKMLVYLYRACNADSTKTVPLDGLKEFGSWTFAELHNLLSPLQATSIVDVKVPGYEDYTDYLIAFSNAEIRLTPTGVLATEDAVTLARQRPGYSVTIHGNDNQVQVATVNSEQLRNT